MTAFEEIFLPGLQNAFKVAHSVAKENKHEKVYPAHLLFGLLHQETGIKQTLFQNEIDVFYLEEWAEVKIEACPKSSKNPEDTELSSEVENIIDEAWNICKAFDSDQLDPLMVLASLATAGVGFSFDELKSFPATSEQISSLINTGQNNSSGSNAASSQPKVKKSEYLINLFAQTDKPKVVGRDQELLEFIEIIGRHSKPHVIITGESGVGKSTLIYGITEIIGQKKASALLNESPVFQLDLNNLFSGVSYKGEMEDRLRKAFNYFENFNKGILFIDDINMLLDEQTNGKNVTYILKNALEKNNFILICTASNEIYRKIFEKDQLLNRHFERYQLQEPNIDKAIEMVQEKVDVLESHHNVETEKEAIEEAIKLSQRHLNERCLPDSAIDLIDRTMSSIRAQLDTIPAELETIKEKLQQEDPNLGFLYNELNKFQTYTGVERDENTTASLENCENILALLGDHIANRTNTVGVIDLASTVGRIKNIPVGKIVTKERDRLINMESNLQEKVIGQDSGVTTLCESILESRSGLNKQGLPIGSFFLLGPTGTGKTELAKQLAAYLFQSSESLIRFDMSEFKEEHSAALLYGAPPGYVGYEEGGLLVNKIRQKPYSVILFDEIEKAHPSVFDIFLQILDEGTLHDRLGKKGDFSNAVILFTSNIGSQSIVDKFNASNELPDQATLMESMAMNFRPEFLGRLTGLVPFAPITEKTIIKIFDIQLAELKGLLQQQGIELEISDEAREQLATEGFNPKYGARPLRGVIRSRLRTPLSRMLIRKDLKAGNKVEVKCDSNKNIELDIIKATASIEESTSA